MKQIKFVFSLFVIAMSVAVSNPMMAQNRKDKKAAKKAEWELKQKQLEARLDSLKNAMNGPVETPCSEYGKSDSVFFRTITEGIDPRMDIARRKASMDIKKKLYSMQSNLIIGYLKQTSGCEIPQDFDFEIASANLVCERFSRNLNGYVVYCAFEVRNSDIVDIMDAYLGSNETLKACYDKDLFRKFAESYMQENKER